LVARIHSIVVNLVIQLDAVTLRLEIHFVQPGGVTRYNDKIGCFVVEPIGVYSSVG
jgi:hypothetical protein